jgi:glutaredoxin
LAIGQKKPVYISKSQEGNSIILTAHNDLDQRVKIILDIKSKGLDLTAGPKITKVLAPNSKSRVVAMTPIPGVQATYKYSLSSEIIDAGEEVVEIVKRTSSRRPIIKNTSRYRDDQAVQNTKENLPTDRLVIFIEDDNPRCEEIEKLLKEKGFVYQVFNITEDEQNHQLMWDALLVYGEKEGKIMLPAIFHQGKVFHSIEDQASFVRNLE